MTSWYLITRHGTGRDGHQRSLENCAESVMEPAEEFFGDCNTGVKDSDGINWWIDSHVEDVSPEEIIRKNQERGKK